MTLDDVKDKKVAICVSGGLDSRTIAKKLVDLGAKVMCFAADLAQPDEKDAADIIDKMTPCGVQTTVVDLKKEMAEACFEVIKAQAMYDGGYWNSTGIARAVTVRGLIPEMNKAGCTVLAHGATGRGNDQMRFERYTNVLAPEMEVYAPWRDPDMLRQFPGRKEMAEFLTTCGIEAFPGNKEAYSTDANLAGLSYEACDLESLSTPSTIVQPQMGCWADDAPDTPQEVTVRFEKGSAAEIDGTKVSPLEAMEKANAIGGMNGIGIKNALESRIIGTKSRGVYEAPGMELLGSCLLLVYQAIMDRRAMDLFRHLSHIVAGQIYDGRYFDPATKAAQAGINMLSEPASGTVKVSLYKGNIRMMSLTDCPGSLYNEADSSMEASDGLNPASSQGYADIQSVEARALARASQIRSG